MVCSFSFVVPNPVAAALILGDGPFWYWYHPSQRGPLMKSHNLSISKVSTVNYSTASLLFCSSILNSFVLSSSIKTTVQRLCWCLIQWSQCCTLTTAIPKNVVKMLVYCVSWFFSNANELCLALLFSLVRGRNSYLNEPTLYDQIYLQNVRYIIAHALKSYHKMKFSWWPCIYHHI